MHGVILLQRWLLATCIGIHPMRLRSLLSAVAGCLSGQRLTLTDLGRHLPTAARPKHSIKRIDRLLGNRHLHAERRCVYRAMAAWMLRGHARPVLLVDWSDPVPGHQFLVLKAALAHKGRAITIYEEVHPLSRYNAPRTHKGFLAGLAEVVPEHCRPIVVSDAGFKGPWFKAVEALGWDWVGRVRGAVNYSDDDGQSWQLAKTLHGSATDTVRELGRCLLAKRGTYSATLCIVRKYHRGPGRPRKRNGLDRRAREARQQHKEPWLLASSLEPIPGLGDRLVELYAMRMQIELTFRDDKGTRWGWQLYYSGSRSVERLNVLLLIASLATFVAWLVGLAAERRDWLKRVQVNTRKNRRTGLPPVS